MLKHLLYQTIWVIPIMLMVVSVFSIVFPWLGINFERTVWCNIGGFSLLTDVMFFYVFYYGKYCIFTKLFPVCLFLVNLVNIWGYYYPNNYSEWYEITVFGLSTSLLGIYQINKSLNK